MTLMNCVIYKISCNDSNITDCYIGSTTDVKQRMRSHKSDCNNTNSKGYKLRVYQFIRANGGWNNWTTTILDEFISNSKFERLQKERDWIQYIKPKLNITTPANFQIDGLYNMSEWGKEWYKQNKDKILERQNTKHICNCGTTCSVVNKSRHIRSKQHQQYLLRESIKQIQEMKYMMEQTMKNMNDKMKIINSLVLYRDE